MAKKPKAIPKVITVTLKPLAWEKSGTLGRASGGTPITGNKWTATMGDFCLTIKKSAPISKDKPFDQTPYKAIFRKIGDDDETKYKQFAYHSQAVQWLTDCLYSHLENYVDFNHAKEKRAKSNLLNQANNLGLKAIVNN